MLTVSENAASAINAVASDTPESGLRISPVGTDGDAVQLQVTVVESPEVTDEVIDEHGTKVFVDRQIAPLLDGKTLDAEVVEDRGVRFAIVD